jgi:short-subunit dehydrogenase
MNKLQFKNKWVLVTGASAGLGREIATQLAVNHGANLILLARRREKLESLKKTLEEQAGVSVKVIITDLADLADVDRALEAALAENNLYAAVLNAGVTYFGPNAALTWDVFENMLKTNVISVVRMTNRLVAYFESNSHAGGILIVSSMAAIFPIPYQAAYSGTKSFLMSFGTALAHEIKNEQLSITVYAPAGIETEMTENEKFDDLKKWLMPVKQAANEAIYGLVHRKAVYIPGFLNRAGAALLKLLPQKIILQTMRNMYVRSLEKAPGR